MLKTILLAAAAALALLLIYAATRPDSFRIERSTRIQAQPDKVFALVNDMHSFNTWNPFEKKDPALKGSYSGAASGKGAAYAWVSDKIGTGSMEIIDTAAPSQGDVALPLSGIPSGGGRGISSAWGPSKVTMKLDFVKPFEAHNVAEFTLVPAGDATEVTWAMHGPSPYLAKLMQVFFSMDKMVGKDFEDGLANLKTLAESR